LIEAIILAPLGGIFEEWTRRRNDATDVVIAYCKIERGDICGVRKHSGSRVKSVAIKEEDPLSL
jgi:hypothetical protein